MTFLILVLISSQLQQDHFTQQILRPVFKYLVLADVFTYLSLNLLAAIFDESEQLCLQSCL